MSQEAKTLVPKRSIGGLSMLSWGSRSRNITPPSGRTLNSDDQHTPPGQISKAQSDPSPDSTQGLRTPPEAGLNDIFVTPFSLGTVADARPSKTTLSQSPDHVLTHDSYGMWRSITGADWSQPIFDGRSKNTKDHLIELDDSSMERIPDVRAYFWAVGDGLSWQKPRTAYQHTLEEARIYDDKVVREGREHIKKCRDKGVGFYLNKGRDFASHNQPGKPWYRMPAFGVVDDLNFCRLTCQPGEEGYFEICQADYLREHCTEAGVILTNIRTPILWADFRSSIFQPGIAKWDVMVMGSYSTHSPIITLAEGLERESVLSRYFNSIRSPDRNGSVVAESHVVRAMVDREWPQPASPKYEAPPTSILEATGGGTPKDFFKAENEDDSDKPELGSKGKGKGKGRGKMLSKLGKTFGRSK